MDNKADELRDIINKSNNIVFFGGAGVSTESNIPDFRTDEGIFNQTTESHYPPEVILSKSFFLNKPEDFFKFYKTKMIYKEAKPNDAHKVLAQLEKEGKLKAVITQNIDGLHQLAGSKNVIELHGTVLDNYCMDCSKDYDLDYVMNSEENIPKCSCGGIVRPDVVLYEEGLNMDNIHNALRFISEADVLIVGGTSLVVHPAAGLIEYFRGNKLILINKETTPYDRSANLIVNDKIGKVLQQAVNK